MPAQAARVKAAIKDIAQSSAESPIYPLLDEMFHTPMKGLLARRKRSDSNGDVADAEQEGEYPIPTTFRSTFSMRFQI